MAEACEEGSVYLFLYKMRGNFLSSAKILSSSPKTLLPGHLLRLSFTAVLNTVVVMHFPGDAGCIRDNSAVLGDK